MLRKISMYQTLTFLHSTTRWLLVAAIMLAIYRACRGYTLKTAFTKSDNAVRQWTATITHIQLMIGIILYSQSPLIHYFWTHKQEAIQSLDTTFFSLIHPVLMLCAIVITTIGAALAKRKRTDHEKFKSMLLWFSVSLIIILITIPWPFSPLATRPYFR